MSHRVVRAFCLVSAMATTMGCSGSGGVAAVLRFDTLAEGDAECPAGGLLVEMGLDDNGNGLLDDEEVSSEEKICDAWVPVVTEDTISVGASGDFAALPEALDSLMGKAIPKDLIVTIEIEDGTYEHTDYIYLGHPDGAQIHIVGNVEDPGAVVLEFVENYGFVSTDSHQIGLIDGVTIQGDGTPATNGVSSNTGATVHLGPNVRVLGFGHSGLATYAGGTILADGVYCADNYVYGFRADIGGVIVANGATAEGNHLAGFSARHGATIYAVGATATGNTGPGFLALSGSYVDADQGQSIDNTAGYRADEGSALSAVGARAEGNTELGFEAKGMSYIDAKGKDGSHPTVACDNAGGSFAPTPGTVANGNSWIDADANLDDSGTGACPN